MKKAKNARMTWDIILTALPKKLNQQQTNALVVNGSVTDDPFLVTNKFSGFFCEIGSKLANNIESRSTPDPDKYLTNKVSNFIFFNDPSHNEILNTIMSLKDKAVWHDNISAFFSESCPACHHSISSYPHTTQF